MIPVFLQWPGCKELVGKSALAKTQAADWLGLAVAWAALKGSQQPRIESIEAQIIGTRVTLHSGKYL